MHLTTRDQQIVDWVYELRFTTQEQIGQLLFSPKASSSCRRRLTLLYHNGYLDRRLIPLRSRFGANRAAYCLDRRGAELVAFLRNSGRAGISWRPVDNDRELYFLLHTLGSNQVRICATLAARNLGYGLVWTDERSLKIRTMRDLIPDPKHEAERLAVIPDGYFRLDTANGVQCFALELDRATVEERPFKEKVRALGEWKVTGAYKRRFGTDSLRVLFVVASTERDSNRLSRIKAWTEAEGGESLFWFAELPQLTAGHLFNDAIWQVAGRPGMFSLL